MPLFAFMLAAATAGPNYYSADRLKADCASSTKVESCFSFVLGVKDASLAYQQWMRFREFCLPEGITRGEIRDATLHYVDIHPGNGDAMAASIVVLALKERYPCPTISLPQLTEPAPASPPPNAPESKPANAPGSKKP